MVVLLDVILGIDFEHLPKYNYCTGKTGPEIFRFGCVVTAQSTGSPGDNSKWVPPDSISNSEVKPLSADDSVGSPHVKVGHRRGITKSERPPVFGWPFCFLLPGNDLLLHGSHVTNNVWNILSCAADPKGERQDAWSKVGHRRGIKMEKPLPSGVAFFVYTRL